MADHETRRMLLNYSRLRIRDSMRLRLVGDEGPASRKDLLQFIDKPLRRRLIYSRLPLSPPSNLGNAIFVPSFTAIDRLGR